MPDRGTMPSPVNTCKGCGRDVLATDLGIAEHRAYHLDWARLYTSEPITWQQCAEAWRAYAKQHELHASTFRGRLADRDDIIANLQEDLYRLTAEVQDLRAELP